MSEVSYRRLDEVLKSLGLAARDIDGKARLYTHELTGAMIVLPLLPEDDLVRQHHLATVRVTLDANGIAAPADLDARLAHAG